MLKIATKHYRTKTFCKLPFSHLKISCEGNVAMCCDQPYGVLGNVLEDSIENILYGNKIEEIKKTTSCGELHPSCKLMFCFYKYINPQDYMEELVHNGRPISLELDLPNTHCNINPGCIMCFRASPDFTPEDDKLEEVCRSISPMLYYLQKIHIQGIAEPFYKDKIFEVLDWLEYDRFKLVNSTMLLSTITNATLFSAGNCQKLIDRCPYICIAASLDAGTAKTYKKIRKIDAFDIVRKNLIFYNENRDPNYHKLIINNNINILNCDEVDKMVQFAAEVGVDELHFDPTTPTNMDVVVDDEIIHDITVNSTNFRLFEIAEEIIRQEAQRLNIKVVFRKPLNLFKCEINFPP